MVAAAALIASLRRCRLVRRGLFEVGAGRRVQDRSRRVDHHAEALAVAARGHGGGDVATLGADAGNQDRQVTHRGAHLCELVGIGGTHDEAAITDDVPLVGDASSDVEIDGFVARRQRLEVAAARVARPAQDEHPTVGVAQERLHRVGAQVRVDRDHVGAVTVEGFGRVALGGAADVAPLGVEDEQHIGVPVADVRTQSFQFRLGAQRREVGDLRLERAHARGSGLDDGHAEVEHRAVHGSWKPVGVGIEADAEHGRRGCPGAPQLLMECHAPDVSESL